MKCKVCEIESPDKVIILGESWLCPEHSDEGKGLIPELERLYHTPGNARYVYVSEFTNNLDKVHFHFLSSIDMNNPTVTISLTQPEGVPFLTGIYDGIFCDTGFLQFSELKELVKLTDDGGFIKAVNPITMKVL